MKSHQYLCTWRELGRALGPTLATLLVLGSLLRAAGHWRLLPHVPTAAAPDSTVLLHQARATRGARAADVLLVGDSTCLVGVDALGLSRELSSQPRVLSLALFIWMDLAIYGEEVADFGAAHPGQHPAVVLLVSPLKLAGTPQGGGAWQLWRWAYDEDGDCPLTKDNGDWLGARVLRQHVLAHLLATPLHGSGADRFGFSSGIEAYLNEHRGSLITFGTSVTSPGAARSVWRLSKEVEADSRAFRAKLPGAKLFIGLTPGPAGASPANSSRAALELLSRWNQWMHADALLTNLPATLPDSFFAGGGHLNGAGQKRFTAALAKQLGPLLH